MAVYRDDDEERVTRSEDLLRRLRYQADISKEERRVVSESMAEDSARMKVNAKRAKARAVNRSVESIKQTRRKPR